MIVGLERGWRGDEGRREAGDEGSRLEMGLMEQLASDEEVLAWPNNGGNLFHTPSSHFLSLSHSLLTLSITVFPRNPNTLYLF